MNVDMKKIQNSKLHILFETFNIQNIIAIYETTCFQSTLYCLQKSKFQG